MMMIPLPPFWILHMPAKVIILQLKCGATEIVIIVKNDIDVNTAGRQVVECLLASI